MRLPLLSLLMLGSTVPALSQEPASLRWFNGSGGLAIPSGEAEYTKAPLLYAQLGFGARIAGIPMQVEGLIAGNDETYACIVPDPPPPCYPALRRVYGLTIGAAPLPGTAYPRTRLGVLVGVGAYRLPAGGDIYRNTRFAATTAFGVHATAERLWYLRPNLGVTVALRPTVIPNVHGRALLLWPLTAGIRAW